MRAVVVYESFWGNTATVARAIAEGIGPEARSLSTDEATASALEGAELVVAGAPLIAFSLSNDASRRNIGNDTKAPVKADLTHPSMRLWLSDLLPASGRYATFETGFKLSPGSATKRISQGMESVGYTRAAKPERFLVAGTYGPMREGEVERARAWGATLARGSR
jgi:hypothetical protein